MTRAILGIDPGQSGAAVLWSPAGSLELWAAPFEGGEWNVKAMREIIDSAACKGAIALIEKVHGMPGQGGQAMFQFGYGYGHWVALIQAAGLRLEKVTPQAWQKAFLPDKMRGAKVPKTERKNRLKLEAQRLFPEVRVTLKNCDALLIAEYGRKL